MSVFKYLKLKIKFAVHEYDHIPFLRTVIDDVCFLGLFILVGIAGA